MSVRANSGRGGRQVLSPWLVPLGLLAVWETAAQIGLALGAGTPRAEQRRPRFLGDARKAACCSSTSRSAASGR